MHRHPQWDLLWRDIIVARVRCRFSKVKKLKYAKDVAAKFTPPTNVHWYAENVAPVATKVGALIVVQSCWIIFVLATLRKPQRQKTFVGIVKRQ